VLPHQGDLHSADFFVSYTQADRAWAEWIAWELEASGYQVLIQAWDFAAGTNFIVEMNKATQASSRTIAVLSTDYLGSNFSTAEWTAALAQDPLGERGTLIPVRVSGPPPTGLLGPIAWVDLIGRDEQDARSLLLAAAGRVRAKPDRAPAFPGESGNRPKPQFPLELPRIWNVPARNAQFTGRTELLARLQPELAPGARVVVTQAIAGLGGIGKTQLAIEYAHRNAARYRLVWWVRAEKNDTREADLLALAQRLSLPDQKARSSEEQIAALRTWLELNSDWLLIFDNVEKPNLLDELLPRIGAGHVLLTSRVSVWGTSAQVVRLDLWSQDEAASYLLRRTDQEDDAAARELAATLGCLPLAIEQAAAYIERSKITLGKYIDLFRTSRAHLLNASSAGVTVATTWNLSLQAVESESKEAVALIQLLAFLTPDDFPRDRLQTKSVTSDRALARLLESELLLNDAVAVLGRYSLINATPETISVHRLVQDVVKRALTDRQHRVFSETAHRIQYGDAGIPEGEPSSIAVGSDDERAAVGRAMGWSSANTVARALQRRRGFIALAVVLAVTLGGWYWPTSSGIDADETVVLLPAFAVEAGDSWIAKLSGWIYEEVPENQESSLRRVLKTQAARAFDLREEDLELSPFFAERARLAFRDNESRKRVQVTLGDRTATLGPSGANGYFSGEVVLTRETHRSGDWIEMRAVNKAGDKRVIAGRLQFVGRRGTSVISDIDDTIKDSNVRDKHELGANTFLRNFRAVAGMAELYRRWASLGHATFHYVSSAPVWLYPATAHFAEQEAFPPGTFHLREFRRQDTGQEAFFQDAYKADVMRSLLRQFPERRFVLIGDSAEQDPELYQLLASEFVAQVAAVVIRDVSGETLTSPRFVKVFAGLPASVERRVFRDPRELDSFVLPTTSLPKGP
jgi:phosphatidate phosphatase APP1